MAVILAGNAGTEAAVQDITGSGQYALMFTGFDVVEGQTLLVKVQSQVSMGAGGESFSGPFTTELYDPQGNLLFSIEGTVEGTRLHVDR